MEKTQSASISIIDRFAGGDDPRMERAGKRKLGDIIAVGVGAVIAGADNRVDIATFGNAKIKWFETFLELPNGISSKSSSNGRSGSGKPPKGGSRRLTARPSGAWLTRRTAYPPSISQARGRPRTRGARTGQGRRPFQRYNRHPRTPQDAGNQAPRRDHRRHGPPEEDSASCRQTGRGLCLGGEEESAPAVGRHSRSLRILRANAVRQH